MRHALKYDDGGLNATQTQLLQSKGIIFRYNREMDKSSLTKLIIKTEFSFLFGEDAIFKWYCKNALQPAARGFSQKTIKNEAIRLYLEYLKQLRNTFNAFNGRMSLTSDIWYDVMTNNHYMCVTIHWIDEEWKIQKRIIWFIELVEQHRGNLIASKIWEINYNYNISDKIIIISFDNASNNGSNIERLRHEVTLILNGQLFHNRCACHILNLCVQDGLQIYNETLAKMRGVLALIRSSESHSREWKEFVKGFGLPYKRFPTDLQTRWNSTYLMLQKTKPYRQQFELFWNRKMVEVWKLKNSDWEQLDVMMYILEIFYSATKIFFDCEYPTTHIFIRKIFHIVSSFAEHRDSDTYGQFITFMKKKLENIGLIYHYCILLQLY